MLHAYRSERHRDASQGRSEMRRRAPAWGNRLSPNLSFGAYLRFEDGRAQKLSGPQLRQDVVGLNERECRRLSLDARLRHNLEKIQSVLTGEVGYRHQLSFFPK